MQVTAAQLQPGMGIQYVAGATMYVDDVQTTRDGQIRVYAGYRPGDDSSTLFFYPDELLTVEPNWIEP